MPEKRKLSSSKLFVKKFGGTSVGSIERIEAVAEQIAKSAHAGERQILVLSAMAGETNRLFSLASNIASSADALGEGCEYALLRERDMLVSTGEQISIALMAMALQRRGLRARSLLGSQVQIHTDSQFGGASIQRVDTQLLEALLAEGVIPVVAGFQGRDSNGEVTTLGRGGSDTTAVALAAAMGANECQIYTDVAGVFTTDPHLTPSARKLDGMSFEVMFDMARLGAKVLHPDSVAYAKRYLVPLRVLSSFEPGPGTLVQHAEAADAVGSVQGIAVCRARVWLSIECPPANEALLRDCLEGLGAEAELWCQDAQDQSGLQLFQVSLAADFLVTALKQLDRQSQCLGLGKVEYHKQLVKVSLVGSRLPPDTGLISQVNNILGSQGIHVRLLSRSQRIVSILIDEAELHNGVRLLHQTLGLDRV
ncbi:aspartate kinase [Shewanella salipaludis]|uniref:Aspartokinase n=1 Tax=Shewanella salipaludis TaxID=2723052 RepID=A0A972FUY4_9GAMM|nr:aspartate kinase [Shewanella salipaludis]